MFEITAMDGGKNAGTLVSTASRAALPLHYRPSVEVPDSRERVGRLRIATGVDQLLQNFASRVGCDIYCG